MEHFTRIAFWIVTLSACLPAESAPLTDSNINRLKNQHKCPSDAKFYTQLNVKDECTIAALDCFKKEMNGTVREECEILPYIINQTVGFLQAEIKEQTKVATQRNGNAPTYSPTCACERAPEKPFGEFLNALESLIQRINSS